MIILLTPRELSSNLAAVFLTLILYSLFGTIRAWNRNIVLDTSFVNVYWNWRYKPLQISNGLRFLSNNIHSPSFLMLSIVFLLFSVIANTIVSGNLDTWWEFTVLEAAILASWKITRRQLWLAYLPQQYICRSERLNYYQIIIYHCFFLFCRFGPNYGISYST